MENVAINQQWIPDNRDSSEITYGEHEVTETEMKFLKLAASFNVFRHQKFGESLKQENQRVLDDMTSKNAKPELIEDAKAQSKKTMELLEKGRPKCLEQVIYNDVYPANSKKVSEGLDNVIYKEHEQSYPTDN